MKIKFKHLLIVAMVGAAYSMNPSWTDHKNRILEGQTHLEYHQDLEFVRKCDFYDYKVFSMMFYQDRLISVGLLQNVHVRYTQLNYCMVSFQEVRSLSGFHPPQLLQWPRSDD
ncbi:MAG: hypothetical protein JNM22_07610 [Saprospiraceae bacterium]|nr:hypothetical protein [Saprospiraceae bacterium]